MKAVIYGIAPDVKIIDISHQVSPQNILQGGLTAAPHMKYFPEGSIHIIVVDPGVGTDRRPIALKTAAGLGISPHTLLMGIAMAASSSFTSPISHPANVLVMGPGGYRFVDYLKVGIPLTLLILAILMGVLPILWPFAP